jgi:hypothetical protein
MAGLAEVATDQGDMKTAGDLWTKLSLQLTRAGQEIVSVRGNFSGNEGLNAVRAIVNTRMEQVSRRYSDIIKGLALPDDAPMIKKIDKLVEHEATKLKKTLTQMERIKNAQAIINKLKCK